MSSSAASILRLIGLPPQPEELAAHLADASAD